MKGNLKNVLRIFVIGFAIILICSCATTVFAGSDPFAAAKSAIESETGVDALNNSAARITGSILEVCKFVAVGIALIMLVMIAAKYMVASAGDRADIKKHAVAYVTGALILFGSATILDILQKFADTNIKTS